MLGCSVLESKGTSVEAEHLLNRSVGKGSKYMNRTDRLNWALDFGEQLAEKLIIELGLDRDKYEHDLFYGHPDAVLRDILYDIKSSKIKVPSKTFEEIISVIDGVRGPVEAMEQRRRYQKVVSE